MAYTFNMVGGGSDADLSGVTAAAGDVRAGKVFVDQNGDEVTGTLPDRGAVTVNISDKNAWAIPDGIHNGSVARISEAERNKISASNIKNGVTILGVTGTVAPFNGGVEHTYRLAPNATINEGDFCYYGSVTTDSSSFFCVFPIDYDRGGSGGLPQTCVAKETKTAGATGTVNITVYMPT